MESTKILTFTKATIIIVFCFLLSNVSGSCLSYGHSCWGAHGKRNGDSTNHHSHHRVRGDNNINNIMGLGMGGVGVSGGGGGGGGAGSAHTSTHWFLSKLAATNPLINVAEPSVDSTLNVDQQIHGVGDGGGGSSAYTATWKSKLQQQRNSGVPMLLNDDKYINNGNNGIGVGVGIVNGNTNDDDDKSITPLVASSTWNAFDPPTDTVDYISNSDQIDDERILQLNPETENLEDLYIISRKIFPTKKQLKRSNARVMKLLDNGIGKSFMNLE